MGKPEGEIEDYMRKQAKKYDFLYYKFVSPSHNGVPDRILIGHGKTVFVELKRPGETPRKLQQEVHKEMRKHGAIVYVIDNKPDVDTLLQELSST